MEYKSEWMWENGLYYATPTGSSGLVVSRVYNYLTPNGVGEGGEGRMKIEDLRFKI